MRGIWAEVRLLQPTTFVEIHLIKLCESPPGGAGGWRRAKLIHPVLPAVFAVLSGLFTATAGATQSAQDGFYTVTPCRLVDTRNPTGPYGGPSLSANSDRV